MELPKPKNPSTTDWQKGDIAIIKETWHDAGDKLVVLGPAIFYHQWWVPVIDGSVPDDPTFFKESGLKKI